MTQEIRHDAGIVEQHVLLIAKLLALLTVRQTAETVAQPVVVLCVQEEIVELHAHHFNVWDRVQRPVKIHVWDIHAVEAVTLSV